eukprot:gene12427-15626_t
MAMPSGSSMLSGKRSLAPSLHASPNSTYMLLSRKAQCQAQRHSPLGNRISPKLTNRIGSGDVVKKVSSSEKDVEETGVTGWRQRNTIVGLCFIAFMLCNMDRVNMSVAILPMSQTYGWDSATVGLVQSSFFW